MCSGEWREPAASGRWTRCVFGVIFVLPGLGVRAGLRSLAPADLARVQPKGNVARPPTARSGREEGNHRSCQSLYWDSQGGKLSALGNIDSGSGWREGHWSVLNGMRLHRAGTGLNTWMREIGPSETEEVYIPVWTKTAPCPHPPLLPSHREYSPF